MQIAQTLEHAEQQLERADDAAFSRLEFCWEGIQFHALSEDKPDGGQIRLRADLGQLYYTIENAMARYQSIELIHSANRGIDGAYAIDKRGTVRFESVTLTDGHLKGVHMMRALTLILLESESHLRALRTYLRPLAA